MKSWNTIRITPTNGPDEWLQWGHDDEAVEYAEYTKLSNEFTPSFNGATRMKSWNTLTNSNTFLTWILLQWGHDDEGVEDGSSPWECCRRRSCFNGATAVNPWKTQLVAQEA